MARPAGRGSWRTPALITAAAGALVLGLGALGVFDAFENIAWDLRTRTLGAPARSTGDVAVILLDQSSLDWAEERGQGLPWPREYYAAVADFLTRAGAKAVIFDVIFDQPSPYAGDDEIFAAALRANGRAVLAEAVAGASDGRAGIPPTPLLAQAASRLGHVTSIPDSDGVNRRVAPAITLGNGTVLPSLAEQAYSLGTGALVPDTLPDEEVLRYRGPASVYRPVPAKQVLNSEFQLRDGEVPELDPAVFRGKYVFFGFSAQGLFDLRPSPVDSRYPGVFVHATALDNRLAGDPARRPAWIWTALLVVVWAAAAAFGVSRLKAAAAIAPLFLLALGLPVAAGWAAYAAGWWWPVVPPAVSALLAGLTMLLVHYATEGRQKRYIQSAFGQYLSPQVIERLIEDPDQLKLGGEKRCLSIFFSDVAGFTSISEKLKDDPQALTALLNDYLSEMTSIIYAHGGTIDKYEGDAVIAFWNAPLDLPDHALQAVRASLACQKRLAEIGPRLAQAAGRPFTARIGLNSGDVVIGNMGSTQRFNYTFLGDAGNLASRLEGINKVFGTRLLVSEFTKSLAGDDPGLVWREIGRVRVVGKTQPVTVFEPLEAAEAAVRVADLRAFDEALRAWYGGAFAGALAGFDALADRDGPSRNYAAKTRELLASPPEGWDGVWTAHEK